MKTDQLIAALAADARGAVLDARRGLWLALCLGMFLSAGAFSMTMGARADLAAALLTWRFDLKLVLVGGALVAAMIDCSRLLRPEVRPSLHWPTALSVLLLAVAVVFELVATPRAEWGSRLIGTNQLLCLAAIPLLALVPLVMLMWAMRRGAPASPVWAGVAVGRLAAATGAALYALHCFDDSPLFVAVWYTAAILMVSAVGAAIGARWLRW